MDLEKTLMNCSLQVRTIDITIHTFTLNTTVVENAVYLFSSQMWTMRLMFMGSYLWHCPMTTAMYYWTPWMHS